MTAKTKTEQTADTVFDWFRRVILAMLLASVAIVLLKAFGVVIPIRTLGHIELAYLAGAYWLTK